MDQNENNLRLGFNVAVCYKRLKKKKGSFFQSITSLQKNSAKVSSRRDQLEEKSTGARNDYILSIAAANAHQVSTIPWSYLSIGGLNLNKLPESNL